MSYEGLLPGTPIPFTVKLLAYELHFNFEESLEVIRRGRTSDMAAINVTIESDDAQIISYSTSSSGDRIWVNGPNILWHLSEMFTFFLCRMDYWENNSR